MAQPGAPGTFLGIIHILEGCEVVDEADAEAKLEALVVRCATCNDFTPRTRRMTFTDNTEKALTGVEKWIQERWLRCGGRTRGRQGDRGKDARSMCSKRMTANTRPGLLLNVLQLLLPVYEGPEVQDEAVRAGTSLQRIARFSG